MDNLIRVNIFLVLLLVLFFVGCKNTNKSEPVPLTYQDTLNFLVSNSDLIAIALLSGGSDEPKISSFSKLPEKVNANILSITKGKEDQQKIKILCTPRYLRPDTAGSIIILRNGKHIVFLTKEGQSYNPTTASSLLGITPGNKIYPIWRPDQYKERGKDGVKVSSGIDLEMIINEITTEITKKKTLQDTNGKHSFPESNLEPDKV